MVVTELTGSQIVRGLAAYRHLAGEKRWPPLVWSFEAGYHFCEDADELEAWERQWAEVKYTEITSVIHGVLEPHARLFPKSRSVQYVVAQMNAIQSSLDMITHPQLQ
ncbi:RacP protein [Streptomyces noboritoensis]|uniref:RacP protein n=1 Tax=Streptomyces noboritoensis TaxID=67337 RepID=A0ABV6TE59_9ACTN